MTVSERSRKRRIISSAYGFGDILPNEFARSLDGRLYWIESMTNGFATVWDTRRPGRRDILPASFFRRIAP
jgi:hypothetical protein